MTSHASQIEQRTRRGLSFLCTRTHPQTENCVFVCLCRSFVLTWLKPRAKEFIPFAEALSKSTK